MSGLFASEQIRELAEEDSVRGVLLRRALREAEDAGADDLRQLEKAVQLLLGRFRVMEDVDS
jgi:hypothetical protein